jgi:hypothetical protein
MTYNNKLIAMITATFMDMILYNNKIKMPYINFLCIQTKIRKFGLAAFLFDELKIRLENIKFNYALFTCAKKINKSFCTTKNFAIPINYLKLKEIGFLTEKIPPIPKIINNPLHLITGGDIEHIVPKLNKFLEKFSVRPYFTNDSARHFLLSKKNIVYSFAKKNTKGEITDFVNIYKNYFYCLDKNRIVSAGHLSFYFYETMTLTQLISHLLDKLVSYDIDQLIFRDTGENMQINITKFSIHGESFHFLYNMNIRETKSGDMCFYPF